MRLNLPFMFCLAQTFQQISVHKAQQTSSCPATIPKLPSPVDKSFHDETKIPEDIFSSCHEFIQLVQILKKLNIISSELTSCYTFNEIKRNIIVENTKSTNKVLVSFVLIEKKTKYFENLSETENVTNKCQSSGTVPIVKMESMAKQTANGNSSVIPQPTKQTAHQHETVLSPTQIVVIATCCTVIGLFFIGAAILRIRNYYKRWREEQIAARKNTSYRLPLQTSFQDLHGSPKLSQAGSITSRQSQNSPAAKGNEMYAQVSNGKSPNPSGIHFLDTMPLLVVTAPSTGQNTPVGSSTSIQYIDEDSDEKKPDNCENTSSLVESCDTAETPVNEEEYNQNSPAVCKILQHSSEPHVEQNHLQGQENCVQSEENDTCHVVPNVNVETDIPNSLLISSGITQSDESLSSPISAYCYGNQSEYSSQSGYGNVAYCPNDIVSNEYESQNEDNIANFRDMDNNSASPNIKSIKETCENFFTSYDDYHEKMESNLRDMHSGVEEIPEDTQKDSEISESTPLVLQCQHGESQCLA